MKAISILSLVVLLAGCTNTPGPDDWKFEVAVIGEAYAKQKLLSPSTAKFPMVKEMEFIKQSDGSYFVKSWVDSQNGFGSMVRKPFSFTVINIYGKFEVTNFSFQ